MVPSKHIAVGLFISLLYCLPVAFGQEEIEEISPFQVDPNAGVSEPQEQSVESPVEIKQDKHNTAQRKRGADTTSISRCSYTSCADLLVENNTDSAITVSLRMFGSTKVLGQIKPFSKLRFKNSLARGIASMTFLPTEDSSLQGRRYFRRQMVMSPDTPFEVMLNPEQFVTPPNLDVLEVQTPAGIVTPVTLEPVSLTPVDLHNQPDISQYETVPEFTETNP